MGKNLIPVIAKELGVEIGEEFSLEHSEFRYRFSDTEFQWFVPAERNWSKYGAKVDLCDLIYEETKIIKLPFEPKENEKYWTYFSDKFFVDYTVWSNTSFDYGLKSIGCVFRTKKEAIKARPEKYKELTGKEWGCDDG